MAKRYYSFTVNGSNRHSDCYGSFKEAEAAMLDTYKRGNACILDFGGSDVDSAIIGSCDANGKRGRVDARYYIGLDTSTGHGINATPIFHKAATK